MERIYFCMATFLSLLLISLITMEGDSPLFLHRILTISYILLVDDCKPMSSAGQLPSHKAAPWCLVMKQHVFASPPALVLGMLISVSN